MSEFLDALRERVLVFDGAFGTWVQGQDLGPDDFGGAALEGCNEHLVLTRPDLIAQMHREYFEVGVDAVETATFGAFGLVLAEYDIADKTYEINEPAARIAKEVAAEFSTPDRPRFVIGSIGPGTKLPSLGHDRVRRRCATPTRRRSTACSPAASTCCSSRRSRTCSRARPRSSRARRAMADAGREVPLMVQVTVETTGRLLVGSEIGAALTALEAMRPDVIGLNCATGPGGDDRAPALPRAARAHVPVVPARTRGCRRSSTATRTTTSRPTALADAHERFVTEFGLNIVGGCCGTTPEHLARGRRAHRHDRAPAPRTAEYEPGCSSIYSHVPFHQELAYLAIGERTNANGSKKFRDAMLDGDWDTCVQMAREQVKEGAHVLDVCVDYVGRDGTADMDEIASRFATQAALPLVFDSTEPPVIEAGLQHSGGKAILNSANLEDGEDDGQALRPRDVARARVRRRRRSASPSTKRARPAPPTGRSASASASTTSPIERYGIEPTDLHLRLPHVPARLRPGGPARATASRRSRRSAASRPSSRASSTILGVSNVSFGLKPAIRHVLNSVFLHECREAGLDAAIVHAARIMPMHKIDDHVREVTLDLIYDRRRDDYDPLTELMALFEGVEAGAVEREDRSGWPVEERLKHRIIDGDRDGLEADLDEQLATLPALAIVNDVLLERHEGRRRPLRLGRDAAAVRAAERGDDEGRGRVPRAAHGEGRRRRQGHARDRHGEGRRPRHRQEPRRHHPHQQRLRGPQHRHQGAAVGVRRQGRRRSSADAIGMSGLLVKSTLIMRENLEELNDLGLADTPVLLGGAALTRTYVERDLREVYEGRLFYGKDAFEGLHTMDTLMAGKRSGRRSTPTSAARSAAATSRPASSSSSRPTDADAESRRAPTSPPTCPIFTPPFLGSRVAKGISLDDIAGVHQRDRAVPQPVAVPARQDAQRDRRRVQGAHPRHAPRRARHRPRPKAGWCPRSRGATSR